MVIGKRKDIRMPAKQGANGLAHLAGTFAMNDSNGEYLPLLASREVVAHQLFDITGAKGVQIQDTINR